MTQSEPSDLRRLRNDADYMRFLIAAGELLSSSLDYRNTLRNVCKAAVQTVADICLLDLGAGSDVERVSAAHQDDGETGGSATLHEYLHSDPGRPAHPVCKVLDSGQPFLAPVIDNAWIARNAASAKHAELMRRLNYRSMIVVPIRSQIWGIAGALTLVRTGDAATPYDEDALVFAQDLGRRCGIAIGKARLHSQTVDIAERLQRAALPATLPSLPDLRLDALYEPADAALLVGGDWYDVFELKNGDIGISVGDVSGHGIESAAQMSSIRNAIRMALVMETDLGKVLEDADFLFAHEVPPGTFCTALAAIFNRKTGTMTIASAGHPSPLMWTRGRITPLIRESSPPLGTGVLSRKDVRVERIKLEPGCTIVFYTDGLTEWLRTPVEGEADLSAALEDTATRNAAKPAQAIRNACIRGAHADDVAILVVRYEGSR